MSERYSLGEFSLPSKSFQSSFEQEKASSSICNTRICTVVLSAVVLVVASRQLNQKVRLNDSLPRSIVGCCCC